MNVVLSTIGKFHTFDLARQMHARGALAAIFSGYPSFKLKNEKLPEALVKPFPWLHAPYMRFPHFSESLKTMWEWQDRRWLDRHVASHLPPCDLFCGLSGSALQTGRTAKARGFGYVCDRGSSHIRFQDLILREEYARAAIPFRGIDPRIIDCEEAEYDLADRITVPSTFVMKSFVSAGIRAAKLRLAPYGVDLSLFYPTAAPPENEFRVLFVGSVSVRKGFRYLMEAFDKLEHKRKHLTVVGFIQPALRRRISVLRSRADISFRGPLPQPELKDIMSSSHVMVLPSVEEGLAMVQAQAMACGCPLISSENTGAADLFTDGVEGFITPIRDSDAIAQRLQTLADDPHLRNRMSAAAIARVKSIGGWNEYGDKMYRTFAEVVGR
jgi:glycosyltransferase involved in cell wall biosynthesis